MPPKKFIFYSSMFGIGALSIMPLILLLWMSILTEDVLRNPGRYAGSDTFWVRAASVIYGRYEMNIWQAQQECVRYDNVLLYVPSNGCAFSNREFFTNLTFSDAEGRYIGVKLDPAAKSKPPLIVLGDSFTMGWGVNDNETYSYTIASKISVPVLNLGVSSYGTARELIRGRMSPRFSESKCIIIQYRTNAREDEFFLRYGALPAPTKERFQILLDYKPRKLSFPEISLRVLEYAIPRLRKRIIRVFGEVSGEQLDDSQANAALQADIFLRLVGRFEEYAQKTIFVWGVDPSEIEALLAATNRPKHIIPIRTNTSILDTYTLDKHLNQNGHRTIAVQLLEEIGRHENGRRCIDAY
jgi:hypothetical protein